MAKDDGYKIRNQAAIHFITFAVVEWVDVFSRQQYKDIVVDSLKYCQTNKGLNIHGWCITSNHLHLILSAKNNDLSAILRDFKKFTSSQIIKAITANEKESRKDWMLSIFEKAGQQNSRNTKHQFWRQDNRPIEVFSNTFMDQKLNYVHQNPVTAGIVNFAVDYIYSSATAYAGKLGLIEVDLLY